MIGCLIRILATRPPKPRPRPSVRKANERKLRKIVKRELVPIKPLKKRPAGRDLLKAVQSVEIKAGDLVIAAKLDRVFRSVSDAVTIAASFKKRAISLRLLDLMGGEDVTTDGMSSAFFGLASVFAQ